MEDGVFLEIFVMKNGQRYNFKTVSVKHLSNVLVEGLMDAIEEIIVIDSPRDKT